MPETPEGPLVLIIDDDDEFRDTIGPAFVRQRLKGRTIPAKDIKSGIRQFSAHDAHSDEPMDLAIVDMHIPPSESSIEIEGRGGLLVLEALRFIRTYKLNHCPVVIFTAYPSYEDCVEAVKNGADGYVPKVTESGSFLNLDLLEAACKKALNRRQEPEHEIPSSNWLTENYAWLCQKYGGKWMVLRPRGSG